MRQHLLEDIRSHALAKPNQFAVCDSEVSITYGALDRFSTSLAMHLQAIGCKTGSRVVVVANRRAIMVAAILGTFKAGCIHVPLDPRMPAARLQYILNDIAPAAVITEEDLRETVGAYLPPQACLLLKEDLERILQVSAATDYVPGPDVSSPGRLLDFLLSRHKGLYPSREQKSTPTTPAFLRALAPPRARKRVGHLEASGTPWRTVARASGASLPPLTCLSSLP